MFRKLTFITISFTTLATTALYCPPSQPIQKNNRYFNGEGDDHALISNSLKIFLKACQNYFSYDSREASSWYQENSIPPQESIEPRITWIGHATFLIQIGTFNILTDPIFYAPAMHKRQVPPGILLDNLPPIHVILISHNHRDHMDMPSLHYLYKKYKPLILVPHNDKQLLCNNGFQSTREKKWWEQETVTQQNSSYNHVITFTFLPAYHWSGRGITDIRKSLWGSWMITYNTTNIYFAGDTAYANYFKEIAQAFPSIDIALMPIGPCNPHEYSKYTHVNAQESIQAFLDLNARCFIPMHWGTFHFGPDQFLDPINQLKTTWSKKEVTLENKQLILPKFGQQLTFNAHH